MTDELTTLRAICQGLQEHFGCLRFEETARSGRDAGVAADVFVFRGADGFLFHKHACLLRVVVDRLHIIPGSLFRTKLVDHPIELELADPTSIDKLVQLFEGCCGEAPVPAADVRR